MKKYLLYCAASVLMAAFSGCSDDFNYDLGAEDGEGRVMLRASLNSDVNVQSRSPQTNDELAKNTIIWISNSGGAVRKFNGIDEVPLTGVQLLSGSYIAEAWAGDSLPASFDARYYKGREEFTVSKGQTIQVDLVCKIANVLVSVVFEDGVNEVLTDYAIEVGHTRGSLTFTAENVGQKGSYMMPSTATDLTWNLTGTTVHSEEFSLEGVIKDVKPATEYVLTVKHNGSVDTPIGAGFVTVEVDEAEVEMNDEFTITSPPQITGVGFDLSQSVFGEVGNVAKRSIWIAATEYLRSVEVACPAFGSAFGLTGNDFELFGMDEAVKNQLNSVGVDYIYTTHEDTGMSELKLNFSSAALSLLPEGEHLVTFEAVDISGRRSSAVMTVVVSNAKVITADVDPDALTTYTNRATIYGTVMAADATGFGFEYRQKGTQQWLSVEADALAAVDKGTSFKAVVAGLTPATTYEFRAVCDNFTSNVVKEFTTEAAPQLPNAGFENWQEPGGKNATLIYGAGEEMFWDSGNHGSAKMSKQVTTPASDVKHSGNYSAKLESQFVGMAGVGAFAAGNMFVGSFLGTENMTKGILGWGRQWTSRPTALRGYIKYTPKAVTYTSTDKIAKGDMDKGIIYIALVDGSEMTYKTYSGWPQIVATADTEHYLFNKNGSNVIAYGERIFTEATVGDGMVEFEIPLDYVRTDIRPSNIIITCSASLYGDYYSGGPSVMYLDDFELVYE